MMAEEKEPSRGSEISVSARKTCKSYGKISQTFEYEPRLRIVKQSDDEQAIEIEFRLI